MHHLAAVAEAQMTAPHTCDRKGPPAKVMPAGLCVFGRVGIIKSPCFLSDRSCKNVSVVKIKAHAALERGSTSALLSRLQMSNLAGLQLSDFVTAFPAVKGATIVTSSAGRTRYVLGIHSRDNVIVTKDSRPEHVVDHI
jgi:hypothetical protein